MVVAQHAEVLAQRGHLRLPHLERRAERVREHHDRCVRRAVEARERHRPDGRRREEDRLLVALQPDVEAVARGADGRARPASRARRRRAIACSTGSASLASCLVREVEAREHRLEQPAREAEHASGAAPGWCRRARAPRPA